MFLDPKWRILTVGDGDLSFSLAIFRRKHQGAIEASVYDSEEELPHKYPENSLAALKKAGVPVYTSIDITDPASVSRIKSKFDLIIFQFPLIESNRSQGIPELDSNFLNRRLLRHFLIHSLRYLLCDKGPQLCYITSKDVSPYWDWNIEQSLHTGLEIPYLGSMPFKTDEFAGYRIRNVRRDSYVLDTQAITYAWGRDPSKQLKSAVSPPVYLAPSHCPICRAGPFVANEDRLKHFESKNHIAKQNREDQWQDLIEEMKM